MRLLTAFQLTFLWACLLVWSGPMAANELKGHPSPYLALHGEDPVDWRDWGSEVMQAAKKENRLVLLSIGYFSCHWCHVMQRESYQNPEIADYLNAHFIPVKVDRELNPALDSALMDFAESTLGRGGWPLNVFVTPEGYPVYATLYSPAPQFLQILQRLQKLWETDQAHIETIASRDLPAGNGPGEANLDFDLAYRLLSQFNDMAKHIQDEIHGGFGEAAKFPTAPQLTVLLDIFQRFDAQYQTAQVVAGALDGMMNGGLRDHLRGGFFRYTVDPGWHTPHFEKMLYDNVQLALLFLRAGKILGHPEYLKVAEETYDFLLSNMRKDDAFISSLSAVDANDNEGGDYLWIREEIRNAISGDEYPVIERMWGLTDSSAFENGGYLPAAQARIEDAATDLKLEPQAAQALYLSALNKLKKIAENRQPPEDDKILAGWNGLALASFAEATRLTGEPRYRRAAIGIRDYLMQNLWKNDRLFRAVNLKRPIGTASLQDYAYVAWGLTRWAMLTQRESDYAIARRVAMRGYELFYDTRGWRIGEDNLIKFQQQQDVIADGPMPSPAAILLRSMIRLANETGDDELLGKALSALNSGVEILQSDPFSYASTLDTLYIAAGLKAAY